MIFNDYLNEWHIAIRDFLVTNVKDTNTPILDIGFGTSTSILLSLGKQVHSLDSWDKTKARWLCDICDDAVQKIPKYDTVTCIGTLEHIPKFWIAAHNMLLLAAKEIIMVNPSIFPYHAGLPYYGDYWRFMPGYAQVLFPGKTIEEKQYFFNNDPHILLCIGTKVIV